MRDNHHCTAVDLTVQQETRLWVAEFQAGLALVDQLTKGQVGSLQVPTERASGVGPIDQLAKDQGTPAAPQHEAASTTRAAASGSSAGANGMDKEAPRPPPAPGVIAPASG